MFIPPYEIETNNNKISSQFLFHTPLYEIQLDVDNDSLSKKIYQLREEDKEGVKKSNMSGGWHSGFRDPTDGVEIYNEALQYLEDILFNLPFNPKISKLDYIDSWSMINKKGSWNQIHNHLYSYNKTRIDLSGVYYVKVPEGDCGNIMFRNPVSSVHGNSFMQLRNHSSKEWEMRYPKAGLMYIFPAYLDHMVLPNNTDEDRIAISFNMTVS